MSEQNINSPDANSLYTAYNSPKVTYNPHNVNSMPSRMEEAARRGQSFNQLDVTEAELRTQPEAEAVQSPVGFQAESEVEASATPEQVPSQIEQATKALVEEVVSLRAELAALNARIESIESGDAPVAAVTPSEGAPSPVPGEASPTDSEENYRTQIKKIDADILRNQQEIYSLYDRNLNGELSGQDQESHDQFEAAINELTEERKGYEALLEGTKAEPATVTSVAPSEGAPEPEPTPEPTPTPAPEPTPKPENSPAAPQGSHEGPKPAPEVDSAAVKGALHERHEGIAQRLISISEEMRRDDVTGDALTKLQEEYTDLEEKRDTIKELIDGVESLDKEVKELEEAIAQNVSNAEEDDASDATKQMLEKFNEGYKYNLDALKAERAKLAEEAKAALLATEGLSEGGNQAPGSVDPSVNELLNNPDKLAAEAEELGIDPSELEERLRLQVEIQSGKAEFSTEGGATTAAALAAQAIGLDLDNDRDLKKYRQQDKTGYRNGVFGKLAGWSAKFGKVVGFLPAAAVQGAQALIVRDKSKRHDFISDFKFKKRERAESTLPESDEDLREMLETARLEAAVAQRIIESDRSSTDEQFGKGVYDAFSHTHGINQKNAKLEIPEHYTSALSNERVQGISSRDISIARYDATEKFITLATKSKGELSLDEYNSAVEGEWSKLAEALTEEGKTPEEIEATRKDFFHAQKVKWQLEVNSKQEGEYGKKDESLFETDFQKAANLARGAGAAFAVGAGARAVLGSSPLSFAVGAGVGAGFGTHAAFKQGSAFKRNAEYDFLTTEGLDIIEASEQTGLEEKVQAELESAQESFTIDRNRRMGGIAIRALTGLEGAAIAHAAGAGLEYANQEFAGIGMVASEGPAEPTPEEPFGYAEKPPVETPPPEVSFDDNPDAQQPEVGAEAIVREEWESHPDAFEGPNGEMLHPDPEGIEGVGIDFEGNRIDVVTGHEAFGNYDSDPSERESEGSFGPAVSPEEAADAFESKLRTEPLVFAEVVYHCNSDQMDGLTDEEYLHKIQNDPAYFEQEYKELMDSFEERGITGSIGSFTGTYYTSGALDMDGDGLREFHDVELYRENDPTWVLTDKDGNELGEFRLGCGFQFMKEMPVEGRPTFSEEEIPVAPAPPEEDTPPEITTQPPEVTTAPPEITTQPPEFTTRPPEEETTPPPEETTQPPEITTRPPEEETTPPPEETTQPPEITTRPPEEETTPPPEVTTQPPEITTRPPEVTTQPPEITTRPPEVTTQPPEITTTPPVEKEPEDDINVNPELPEEVQMGDDEPIESGELQPEETVVTPPEVYNPPSPEPDPVPETAPEAEPIEEEVREEEVEEAPVADNANSEIDEERQEELEDSGAGSLEEDEDGTPIGNDGRVDG